LQRSPDPLAGFKGPTSKKWEGEVWDGKAGGEGKVREEEGKGQPPPVFWLRTVPVHRLQKTK